MTAYGTYLTRESRVIVLGLPRYGKTTLVRDVLTADAPRVLFHDVTGHDYYAGGRLPLSIDELEANEYLLDAKYVRLVVICADAGDPDVIKDEVKRIIALVIRHGGNIVLVFDELHTHRRKTDFLIDGLFAKGNHWGIATIIAAQKATHTPLGARTVCSDCYCFGQHHPRELDVLFDCFGDIFAAKAAMAKKHEKALHWSEENREEWWSEFAIRKHRLRSESAT